MMPSRGTKAVGAAPRLFQAQCRNLSSTSRIRPTRSLQTPLRSPQWRSLAPTTAGAYAFIRHASTTPTSPPTQAPIPDTSSTSPNLDTITLDDVTNTLASDAIPAVPDGVIGHLHAVGLDYGMGPTSMIEYILEHMHVWGGLPWWGSILATAALLRIITFPLYLKAADSNARQAALVTVTKPIMERMQACQRNGDSQGTMMNYQQLGAVRKQAGLSFRHQFAPMLVQSVIGYCGFKLTRNMASLPVPGLTDGGFLWITDLTVSDGFLILPALMALSVNLMVRFGGETGNANSDMINPGMKAFMRLGMPGLIFIFTGWQPAAVGLWFAGSGAFGMLQAMLLQQPKARAFFGIAPLYKPKNQEEVAVNPFSAMLDSYKPKPKKPTPRTIDTTATVKGVATAASSASQAVNSASYMQSKYQAPNIRTTPSNSTRKSSTVAQRGLEAETQVPEKKSIVDQAKGLWEQGKKAKATVWEMVDSNQEEKLKKAARRRAEDHERKYQSLKNQGARR